MNTVFKVAISIVLFSGIMGTTHAQKLSSSIKGEEISFTGADGVVQKSYVAYDSKIKGKRAAILVVPEWWGCNEYVRMRANMLAELGYIAIAVDMYGDGKMAPDVASAQKMAGPFYKDPQLTRSRLEAAIKKVKEYPETDPAKIAAVGYCFGGNAVLNAARMGMNLKAVVSFHGNLEGVQPKKGEVKAKILVCHGGDDEFISHDEVSRFKAYLDLASAKYTFKVYDGATHAFTNPAADATGKKFDLPIRYNEAADKKSWTDMKEFLKTALL